MIRNFFTTALRNMTRQKGYTLLNIVGLTIGIASTLFILLYLNHELSYDTYHEHADNVYRISSQITEPDNSFKWAVTQFPLGMALKQEYPEVEQYVRFIGQGRSLFEIGEKRLYERKIMYVDSTVFEVFSFDMLAGDKKTALFAPNSIVLNRSVAEKFFGSVGEAMDKTLKIDGEDEMKVTGVFEDMPSRSHIIVNAMISSNTLPQRPANWGSFGIYTYVKLVPGSDPIAFEGKLEEVITKYVATIFDQFDITVKYSLLPIKTIHLHSDFEGEPEPVGNMNYIYLFAAVGIFMLLIACINYMNLATARSAKRAREVGIRKVLGSWRIHLIGQFLAESVLLTLISMALSLLLIFILLPTLNSLLDLSLDFSLLFQPLLLLSILGILVLVGIIGGSYPAFFLSSFQPASVLKGSLHRIKGNVPLRKILVVTQFAISLAMLICTGIVYDQLNFLQEKDLGFTQDQVIRFGLNQPGSREKWPVLREKLLQHPGVIQAGTANSSPGLGYSKQLWTVENKDGVLEQKGMDHYYMDYDFVSTLEMEIVEGRNFSREIVTDTSTGVLVNEAMVKRMSWDNPIGKRFQFDGQDSTAFSYVIGVVKNYHHQSLYNPIEPMLFRPNLNNGNVHVRIRPDNPEETVDAIKQTWAETFPTIPFEYVYLDTEFQAQYEEDQRRSKVFSSFALLTIIIACLGLLGLASFSAEQRTKEIGVRKVIGASVQQLLILLTKDFVILLGIASLIAFPVAWYLMKGWLEDFAYATEISWLTFVGALIITLVITILTTTYHAYKAATANPVEALKYE